MNVIMRKSFIVSALLTLMAAVGRPNLARAENAGPWHTSEFHHVLGTSLELKIPGRRRRTPTSRKGQHWRRSIGWPRSSAATTRPVNSAGGLPRGTSR